MIRKGFRYTEKRRAGARSRRVPNTIDFVEQRNDCTFLRFTIRDKEVSAEAFERGQKIDVRKLKLGGEDLLDPELYWQIRSIVIGLIRTQLI